MDNALDQPIQRKLDTFKKSMINEVTEILGLAEVHISWSKIHIKKYIYIMVNTNGLQQ